MDSGVVVGDWCAWLGVVADVVEVEGLVGLMAVAAAVSRVVSIALDNRRAVLVVRRGGQLVELAQLDREGVDADASTSWSNRIVEKLVGLNSWPAPVMFVSLDRSTPVERVAELSVALTVGAVAWAARAAGVEFRVVRRPQMPDGVVEGLPARLTRAKHDLGRVAWCAAA